MEDNFESKKNLQALGITVVVCGAVLLFFFLVGWTLPQLPPVAQDEGIEVNLGNSDQGQGDIAPAIPGEAAAEPTTTFDPPPSAATSAPEEPKPLEESNEPDATPMRSPDKPATKPNPRHTETSVAHKKPKAVVPNPTPVPPKPKAVYAGGKNTSSNSGNGADSYNGVRNQGIAGGKGDQGKPNGNPNSDSYTGNGGTGKSGVSIRSGLQGRRFTRFPSFQDDFNENAKVAVDVVVDQNGNVTSAVVNPRGTTTTNASVRSIAIRKANQLKFNAGTAAQQSGTIVFDFKLNG